MAKHLYPCLWFNGNITEATKFYCSLFENSSVQAENSIITKFEIAGTTLKLLNGGISWQILPNALNELMRQPDTAEKARNAFMKMRKIIVKDLY